MDNIQKLIVGVLGISGMLAMLTPSNVPFAAESNAVPPPVAAPELPANGAVDELPADELVEDESIEEGDDFVIGEPAIDGNPIGVSSQPNEAPAPDYGQLPDYGTGNFAQQPVVAPQIAAGPPPPGILVSNDNGQ
jgi:hypothetical protein